MKLSPPLAVTGIIAASFAWMAWENRNMKTAMVYYGDVYWLCEDGTRESVIFNQPNHCPQPIRTPNVPVIKTLYYDPAK